jgi:tetratricopeptide (TPR) repeat protein
MKSERRHELQQNQLLEWLSTAFEAIKPYTNAILGAILLVVVIILATTLWARLSSGRASEAWQAYYMALNTGSVADLENVAEKHPSTEAGYWALLTAADLHLNSGCNQLFVDKTKAKLDLERAISDYLKIDAAASAPVFQQRAAYGLARAYEAQGDLDKAIAQYKKVADQWPEGTFAKVCKARAADLQQLPSRKFYDDFAKYDPKPEKPGAKLPFDAESLKEPVPPGAAKPQGGKPAETKPAETKPAEAKPAEMKPAEAKPAEAKPAETKPAETKKP